MPDSHFLFDNGSDVPINVSQIKNIQRAISSVSLAWVFHTDNILLDGARGLLRATDAAPFYFGYEMMLVAIVHVVNAKMCVLSNESNSVHLLTLHSTWH